LDLGGGYEVLVAIRKIKHFERAYQMNEIEIRGFQGKIIFILFKVVPKRTVLLNRVF
jgi:hypothetical protein